MGFNNAVLGKRPEFTPSTGKDLDRIRKGAAKRDAAKREKAEEPRAKHKWPKGTVAIREALQERGHVRIFRAQLFDALLEACKATGQKPPAYRLYEKERDADASFMFDMQQVLARLNWRQLMALVDAAVGVPVPSRTFSSAFWFSMQVLVQAFEVENYLESKKGKTSWVTIKDRDALDQWPIPGRKRKSSNDNEEKEMLVDADNHRKLSAKGGDEEEEEDKVVEEDDEEEDEEDEKPAKKKPAAKAKRKTAGGFGGKAKKKATTKDDDEEEDTPKPRKKKAVAKDDDEDDEPAKVLSDKSIVAKIGERDKGGPKSKLLALIPKKGITVKELTIAAKEEGIPAGKIKSFVNFLIQYEYVKIK